jgi:hypothetical protein
MKKSYIEQTGIFKKRWQYLLALPLLLLGHSGYAQYCTPYPGYYGCIYDDDINTFILIGENSTSINQPNTGCSSGSYSNQTALSPVSLYPATSYTATVSSDYGSGDYCAIWIDFNDDQTFSTTERVATYSQNVSTSGSSVPITIPGTAPSGQHRMRVMVAYAYDQNYNSITAADFDPCNGGTHVWDYGEVHDYTINIAVQLACANATFPTSVTATADKDTICVSGADIHLDMTTTMPAASGITYQWQSSSSGSAPWTNIGTAQLSTAKTMTNVSTGVYYRCNVLCDGNSAVTSNAVSIVVIDPLLVSTTDSFRCGPGAVTLKAAAEPGNTLQWYADADGGSILGSGNAFLTPNLTATDTFYVSAVMPGIPGAGSSEIIGDGTSTTSDYPSPFDNIYTGVKTQMLVRASELQAAGFSAGDITAIGFDVLGLGSTYTFTNFNVSIGQTTSNALTSGTFESGLTQVYSNSSFTATANSINQFVFNTPFAWDGTSNIVLETCYNNSSYTFSYPTIRYTTGLGFTASQYKYDDDNSNICSNSTTGLNDGDVETSTSRPNIQFTITYGCSSPRQAVIAEVYPNPSIALGNDTSICEGSILTLDAGNPGADYLWNDASTSQTLSASMAGSYFVAVNLNGCIASDTIKINQVYPNPDVDLGPDQTLCEGGSAIILDAGNPGDTYLWSTSATTQTVAVSYGGLYSVMVRDANLCKDVDTIQITESGLPFANGITGIQAANGSFDFTATSAQFIESYLWDFGDGTGTDTSAHPNHNYIFIGNYQITLVIANNCGVDTITAALHYNGVGIDLIGIGKDELRLYPNPAKDQITLQNTSDYKMESVTVYNVLGQVVYQGAVADAKQYQMDITGYASGIYTLRIEMNTGSAVMRKFEVIK